MNVFDSVCGPWLSGKNFKYFNIPTFSSVLFFSAIREVITEIEQCVLL